MDAADLRHQLEAERQRSAQLQAELDGLRRAKQAGEEGPIAPDLLQRLRDRLTAQETQPLATELEAELHAEQVYVAGTLLRRVEGLVAERAKLQREKAELENALEAEQEYISNKLSKQVEKLGAEKRALQLEIADLQRHVGDLALSVQRLSREKVELEAQFEQEEESIVNRLQRQLEQVTTAYHRLEGRLDAAGVSLGDPPGAGIDHTTEWIYGRSPSRGHEWLAGGSGRRERSLSTSSAGSQPVGSASSAHGSDWAGALPGARRVLATAPAAPQPATGTPNVQPASGAGPLAGGAK